MVLLRTGPWEDLVPWTRGLCDAVDVMVDNALDDDDTHGGEELVVSVLPPEGFEDDIMPLEAWQALYGNTLTFPVPARTAMSWCRGMEFYNCTQLFQAVVTQCHVDTATLSELVFLGLFKAAMKRVKRAAMDPETTPRLFDGVDPDDLAARWAIVNTLAEIEATLGGVTMKWPMWMTTSKLVRSDREVWVPAAVYVQNHHHELLPIPMTLRIAVDEVLGTKSPRTPWQSTCPFVWNLRNAPGCFIAGGFPACVGSFLLDRPRHREVKQVPFCDVDVWGPRVPFGLPRGSKDSISILCEGMYPSAHRISVNRDTETEVLFVTEPALLGTGLLPRMSFLHQEKAEAAERGFPPEVITANFDFAHCQGFIPSNGVLYGSARALLSWRTGVAAPLNHHIPKPRRWYKACNMLLYTDEPSCNPWVELRKEDYDEYQRWLSRRERRSFGSFLPFSCTEEEDEAWASEVPEWVGSDVRFDSDHLSSNVKNHGETPTGLAYKVFLYGLAHRLFTPVPLKPQLSRFRMVELVVVRRRELASGFKVRRVTATLNAGESANVEWARTMAVFEPIFPSHDFRNPDHHKNYIRFWSPVEKQIQMDDSCVAMTASLVGNAASLYLEYSVKMAATLHWFGVYDPYFVLCGISDCQMATT